MPAAIHPSFDTTDLPQVRRAALALAMHLLIEDERGLVMLNGSTAADRKRLEAMFWECYDGDTREGVATLVRLWAMVDVFQTRRLKAILLGRGFKLIEQAVTVAASSRINLDWGFNPQRFLMGLREVEAETNVPALSDRDTVAGMAVAA